MFQYDTSDQYRCLSYFVSILQDILIYDLNLMSMKYDSFIADYFDNGLHDFLNVPVFHAL